MITSCLGSVFVHLFGRKTVLIRQVLLWMSGISNWCCIRPWQFSNLWHSILIRIWNNCAGMILTKLPSPHPAQKNRPNRKKTLNNETWKTSLLLKKSPRKDLQPYLTPNHPQPRSAMSQRQVLCIDDPMELGRSLGASFQGFERLCFEWRRAFDLLPLGTGGKTDIGSRFGCLDVNGIGSPKKSKSQLWKDRCYIKKSKIEKIEMEFWESCLFFLSCCIFVAYISILPLHVDILVVFCDHQ